MLITDGHVGRVRGIDAETLPLRCAGSRTWWPPDPAALGVVCDLDLGPLLDGEADFRELSDDQSITVGYAIDLPAAGWLPPEHWLAWQIVRELARLRIELPELRLGPDGKAAVLCLDEPGEPVAVEAVTVSLQQAVGADEIETLRRAHGVVEAAMAAAPGTFAIDDLASRVLLNGAGNFGARVHGPMPFPGQLGRVGPLRDLRVVLSQPARPNEHGSAQRAALDRRSPSDGQRRSEPQGSHRPL